MIDRAVCDVVLIVASFWILCSRDSWLLSEGLPLISPLFFGVQASLFSACLHVYINNIPW